VTKASDRGTQVGDASIAEFTIGSTTLLPRVGLGNNVLLDTFSIAEKIECGELGPMERSTL
jgi:hypothetical protein